MTVVAPPIEKRKKKKKEKKSELEGFQCFSNVRENIVPFSKIE